jgi:D-sedoheptulose 7-phosphate isomerase
MTSWDAKEFIRRRIIEGIELNRRLLDDSALETFAVAVTAIVDVFRRGGKAIFFGNGGSAADAEHLAAELVGRYYLDRRALPAVALTVHTAALTAIANDYSFDSVFSRQMEALARAGDVAVGLSTSGNSENVVRALKTARAMGLMTVALTGNDGGRVKDIVDCCIRIPSSDVPRIQECHALLGHILCELVEQRAVEASPES